MTGFDKYESVNPLEATQSREDLCPINTSGATSASDCQRDLQATRLCRNKLDPKSPYLRAGIFMENGTRAAAESPLCAQALSTPSTNACRNATGALL